MPPLKWFLAVLIVVSVALLALRFQLWIALIPAGFGLLLLIVEAVLLMDFEKWRKRKPK